MAVFTNAKQQLCQTGVKYLKNSFLHFIHYLYVFYILFSRHAIFLKHRNAVVRSHEQSLSGTHPFVIRYMSIARRCLGNFC